MACDTPFHVEVKGRLNKVPVPCGKCPPCKLRRINDWVFRLKQEDKVSKSSCFITLTYDTKHVPITDNGFLTLKKRDLQLFFKRLRKRLPETKIKYYACGEYGSKTMRPHYHAILFNCNDPQSIDDSWGLGDIHVGSATGDSMAYCLKYISKQNQIPQHRRDDRVKEFNTQSKHLGASYLSDAVVQYHRNFPNDLRLRNHQYFIAMPRYYRNKIFNQDERTNQLDHITAAVAAAKVRDRANFDQLGYDNLDYDRYCDLRRIGRYNDFYSSINQKRNAL